MAGYDIERIFTYHAPKPDQLPRYERIRAKAREFAELILADSPPSREQSMALSHVQEAVMCTNAAIAIHEA